MLYSALLALLPWDGAVAGAALYAMLHYTFMN